MIDLDSIVIHLRGDPFADGWLERFQQGIDGGTIVQKFDPSASVAVFWGMAQRDLIDAYANDGINMIFIEYPFVGDRERFASVGWQGIKGYGEYRNNESPSDRWDRYHSGAMAPWRTPQEDGHILILGQPRDWHQAERDFDLQAWYERIAKDIDSRGFEARYRPHPLEEGVVIPNGTVFDGEMPFSESLNRVRSVVVFSTNAGVEAALAGVPVMSGSGASMAMPVSSKNLDIKIYDRQQWAYNLAYTQWTVAELESGETWQHLNK